MIEVDHIIVFSLLLDINMEGQGILTPGSGFPAY